MEVIASANSTLAAHAALLSRVRIAQKSHRRRLRALPVPPTEVLSLPLLPSPPRSRSQSPSSRSYRRSGSPAQSHASTSYQNTQQNRDKVTRGRHDLPPAKRARAERYANYVPEEETVRNDYCAHFGQSGEWPQNFVAGSEPSRRFEEYPKQRRLLELKKAAVASCACTPYILPFSAHQQLSGTKFDVIVLDPPYGPRFGWDDLAALPVPQLAAEPSFVFLWVGSGAGEGLERGREVLAAWGYRRCEDVVWVKTNKESNNGPGTDPPTSSLLVRTKQHCLVGIRGTVRRSTDAWFVHCNVDTDVIIWEGSSIDPAQKPPELQQLIENFCLGTRRLELFGRATSIRPGWVTALAAGQDNPSILQSTHVEVIEHQDGEGSEEVMVDDEARRMEVEVDEQGRETVVVRKVNMMDEKEGGAQDGGRKRSMKVRRWEKERWEKEVGELANGGKLVVSMSAEIDALRPKSPVRPGRDGPMGGGGGGGPGHMQQHGGPVGPGMGMGMPMNPNIPMQGGPMNMGMNMNNMNMGMHNMNMNNVGMNMGMPMNNMPMNGMGMGPGMAGGMNLNAGGMGNMGGVMRMGPRFSAQMGTQGGGQNLGSQGMPGPIQGHGMQMGGAPGMQGQMGMVPGGTIHQQQGIHHSQGMGPGMGMQGMGGIMQGEMGLGGMQGMSHMGLGMQGMQNMGNMNGPMGQGMMPGMGHQGYGQY